MLTRNINYKRVLSDNFLRDILENSYHFFKERVSYKGYRYEQDKWENLEEYRNILTKVQEFKELYVVAFNHRCALCLSEISFKNCELVFSHPIGQNKEYPELIKEVKNLMPLCKVCSDKYQISYKKKLPKNIDSIYDLNKRVPSIVIPHLESTIQHMSYINGQYSYGTNRLDRSMAMFAPDILNYAKSIEIYSDHLESARLDAYEAIHHRFINSYSEREDYDYACFIFDKNAFYTDILIKNHYKPNDKYKYRHFSPVNFSFQNLRELGTGTLVFGDKNYICILGENGVGKSTLMQSVFGAISSSKNSLFYNENFFFRRNSDLNLSFKYQQDSDIHEKFFKQEINDNEEYFDNNNVDKNSNHRNSEIVRHQESNHTQYRFKKDIKVISLDDGRNNYGKHEKELEWLFLQNNDTFSKVAIIIKNFLNFDDSTLYRNKDRIFAEFDGKRQDLGKLSSGYKAIISIVISIFRHLNEISVGEYEKASIEKYQLLALIDEIELHLHPKWKTTIVKKLTENFPKVFFIITTHDPLVLQQCDDECCIKIEKNERGRSDITSVIDFSDYDIDMLLSSPLFEADYEPSPHERLKGESLRTFFARKIVNESIQKHKRLSIEELSIKLELAVRNAKN
ncbi:AAA family ATPase [Vibrio diabolicus]|uniref:AAA family ATPase n=4 Tax=Vibrio harveyi group TaxID=717610 RepID=UPI002160E142|nr:AAA family ATPase [Vibrio diabolicus]MCS0453220.1 AAA family ATPase [Vibrio diabolicus]